MFWKRYHFTLHSITGIYAISFDTTLEEWNVYKFLSMLVLAGYIAHYSLVFCEYL